MKSRVLTAEIKPAEPVKAYVGDDGIWVPHCVDPTRCHMMLISKDLFVEAYKKWIKPTYDTYISSHHNDDDADCWCD